VCKTSLIIHNIVDINTPTEDKEDQKKLWALIQLVSSSRYALWNTAGVLERTPDHYGALKVVMVFQNL
jgi:hypothetical protein